MERIEIYRSFLSCRSEQLDGQVAVADLVKHMDNVPEDDSSSDDKHGLDDDEGDQKEKQKSNNPVQRSVPPLSRFRLVTRLTGRHSPSKMRDDATRPSPVLNLLLTNAENLDVPSLIDDSDDDDAVVSPPTTHEAKDFTNDLKEIHQRVLQHDQEQMKGIQFANAGTDNLKVVNSYSVSSTSCILL